MKQPVYLNYAATSNQKFDTTIDELCAYLKENNSTNTNRSINTLGDLGSLFDARQVLADFFHAPDPAHVIFTSNATMALNMVLHGLLKPGDHVLTTMVEHNAVTRPLQLLETERNVVVTHLVCAKDGSLDPEQIETAIRGETKVLVMTHASNVLGTILPVKECFEKAKKHGIITILDSAQTAGILPINMEELSIDILTFTGHKSLMGLSGIGGFVLGKNIEKKIDPWLTGGTGSASHLLTQPDFLPDKFEPGTLNMLGIISLKSAVTEIQRLGLEQILMHERMLTKRFLDGVKGMPIEILGCQDAERSVPVVSLVSPKIDSGELAQRLADAFQIITRSGLHCAPLAHETAGTIKTGAVRFSFGWQTTTAEIDYALSALESVLSQ
ncbi:selenocysteine lyase SclA [Enterococcus wangshanyuanii]|uniref:cysteine desulfurase n=1 Tax=Enterococcus wangshanyuanii TaxID=2005703 RepID=A0ABQ1NJL0_9ENTE|nr:selenocysteine lyase SclA [Enterococcus wangshanyuanii]GGC78839.1 class V aminotransferase [Enterococcus wangshanyuanii]